MKVIPKYNVVYHGVMRKGGVPFEIDEADADEMREYCAIEPASKGGKTEAPASPDETAAQTAEAEETSRPEAAAKPKTRTKKKAEQA